MQINYQSLGSGAGIRQVSERVVDFGASDFPLTDEQMAEAQVPLLHVPTALGAVVPVYNLPGLPAGVRLSPEALAGIYLGRITRWNDPLLARDNPGVALPAHAILPVYRSDGAGTTFIFTDYLSRVSPAFAAQVGRSASVRWPTGVGAKGSEGVAGFVRDSPYTLGYVELVYAEQDHLATGLVRNRSGAWVGASMPSLMAAAEGLGPAGPTGARAPIADSPRPGAYPIAAFTWLLIPIHSADPAKGRALVDFLRWMFAEGEREAPAMSYAPLPAAVSLAAQQSLEQLR